MVAVELAAVEMVTGELALVELAVVELAEVEFVLVELVELIVSPGEDGQFIDSVIVFRSQSTFIKRFNRQKNLTK